MIGRMAHNVHSSEFIHRIETKKNAININDVRIYQNHSAPVIVADRQL